MQIWGAIYYINQTFSMQVKRVFDLHIVWVVLLRENYAYGVPRLSENCFILTQGAEININVEMCS